MVEITLWAEPAQAPFCYMFVQPCSENRHTCNMQLLQRRSPLVDYLVRLSVVAALGPVALNVLKVKTQVIVIVI